MSSPAGFADGRPGQIALFAALLGLLAVAVVIATADKLERIGRTDVGWTQSGSFVSPTRDDASDLGLRGGGRLLRVNGVPYGAPGVAAPIRREPGAVNRIEIETPNGDVRTLSIPVRAWEAHDALFAHGGVDVLGLLFGALGIAVFVLRPWDPSSWALLAISITVGCVLLTQLVPLDPERPFVWSYYYLVRGLSAVVALHGALAFPVVHRWLARGNTALWLVYGFGLFNAIFQIGWRAPAGPLRTGPPALFSTSVLMGSLLLMLGHWGRLALRGRDSVVRQRARILLAGGTFGVLPLATVLFLQYGLGRFPLDVRFANWLLVLLWIALVRVTLRQELVNARVAVRRGFVYAAVAGVLAALTLALEALHPLAPVGLLLVVLYGWPRFVRRLDARLQPKRAQLPALGRALASELFALGDAEAVLGALASAPARLLDARGGAAFLLGGPDGSSERLRAHGLAPPPGPLAPEAPVQLLVATRSPVLRDHLAVAPQYAAVREAALGWLDRMDGEALLPLVDEGQGRVLGGLVVGRRPNGDACEEFELDALASLAAQAVQTLARIAAMERLRDRERELADLSRFFPQPIIEQVMARGGAAELRSGRKPVTVFFADLRGFTAFAERAEPEEVIATLAEFHETTGKRVLEYGGTLERFTGDGFMVFFNDPIEQPDHAERAARMALAIRRDLAGLRAAWRERGYGIDLGMGIHTGYATVGFIGFEGRRDYGVIGTVTNLAARLSDAAAGGDVLVSARLRAELPGDLPSEPAGKLTLKGFQEAQAAHRLLDSSS